MKAEELMIGDWVNYRPGWIDEETKEVVYESKTGFPIRLTCLYDGLSQYDDVLPDGSINTIEVADYELLAIPITPALLERNGFGYKEKDAICMHFYPGEPHYCADMDFHIGTVTFGVYWLNYHGNDIHGLRFVHELQHAFRLCRIEKEVVL